MPESFKEKSQAPINQPGKIHMNTEVTNERPGNASKQHSTKFYTEATISKTKSPPRMSENCNVQRLTKSLRWSYNIESMDSDTDSIVASLNPEYIINNYNTWNHFTVCKRINSISF